MGCVGSGRWFAAAVGPGEVFQCVCRVGPIYWGAVDWYRYTGGGGCAGTTFVVNLRHALYSTSLAPQMKHLPRRWQVTSWPTCSRMGRVL